MILGKHSVAKSAASGSAAQIENIFCLHRGDLMRLVHLVHFHVRLTRVNGRPPANMYHESFILTKAFYLPCSPMFYIQFCLFAFFILTVTCIIIFLRDDCFTVL